LIMNASFIKSCVEWSLRLFVGMSIGVYGIAKTTQFDDPAVITTAVKDLSGMRLMWAFYGYSKPYVMIIGVLEMLGGLMLMFNRTKLLACLLLTVILSNIILQDIYYGVNQGALWGAIFYQLFILILLFGERARLAKLFQIATAQQPKVPSTIHPIVKISLIIALSLLLEFATRLITHNS